MATLHQPMQTRSQPRPLPASLSLTPPPSLMGLPTDVLLELAEHLDPASLTALSLTCSAAYHGLRRQRHRHPLNLEDRHVFFSALERDIRDAYFLCPACSKLHRYFHDERPFHIPVACMRFMDLEWYRLHSNNSSPHVATEARLLGPRWPPSVVSDIYCDGMPHHWARTSSAKRVEGELFIRIDHNLDFPRDCADIVMFVLAYRANSLCPHRGTHRMRGNGEKRRLSEIDNFESKGIFCSESIDSCDMCLTDFVVTIERRTGSRGDAPLVRVVVYHQLGPWRLRNRSCSRPLAPDHPKGIVKRRWDMERNA